MVVNYVLVEDGEITVGATDLARWNADRAEGASGADARTSVSVSLRNGDMETSSSSWRAASGETVSLHCPVGDPMRTLSIAAIPTLLDLAQNISRRGLSEADARTEFFGRFI